MKKIIAIVAAAGLLIAGGFALKAQTIIIPKVTQIGVNDVFQDVVNGAPQAQNYYATAAQLGVYGMTLSGAIDGNRLIGGDFGTNLWAYTTTPAAVNQTSTYVANRWFAWGGSSSTLTITQQTGAADITPGSLASMRVSRAGNGLTQVCVAQEVETLNAVALAGSTAEFTLYAKAGSTFSAASSNLALYVYTSTITDSTQIAQNSGTFSAQAAFGINAGGGAAVGQTGGALLGPFLVPITTSMTRVGAAVPIPTAATSVTVAACYTPVGNGASTDWFEFSQAQLIANPAVTTFAGTAGAAYSVNDVRMKDFQNRTPTTEAALQQRYYVSFTEPSAGVPTPVGAGVVNTINTQCDMIWQLPVPMRTGPILVATGTALSTSTFRIQDSVVSTIVAGALVQPYFSTPSTISVRAALTTSSTVGFSCLLQGAGGGAILNAQAEL
jgi:hypothetical protein